MRPDSLFSLVEHLERLIKDGDPLEVLAGTAEFERFRQLLAKGLAYGEGAKEGRPAFSIQWRCSRCWWFKRSIICRMRA